MIGLKKPCSPPQGTRAAARRRRVSTPPRRPRLQRRSAWHPAAAPRRRTLFWLRAAGLRLVVLTRKLPAVTQGHCRQWGWAVGSDTQSLTTITCDIGGARGDPVHQRYISASPRAPRCLRPGGDLVPPLTRFSLFDTVVAFCLHFRTIFASGCIYTSSYQL